MENGWKIKRRKHAKKSSFLYLYCILRAIRAGRCRERRYADLIFIQIYSRMHHFVVKFSKFSSPQALTPRTKILRTFLRLGGRIKRDSHLLQSSSSEPSSQSVSPSQTHVWAIHTTEPWHWNLSSHADHSHNHKLYTHTHPFNGPLSGTTRVGRYQNGKINLDFTDARDTEWQWHQLNHMQVCTSLQTDNHTSTPPLCFYRPDALPAAQPTASKHWRHQSQTDTLITILCSGAE